MIYQRFSKRQRLTLTWWNDSRFKDRNGIICDGSIRSGKTLSMSVGFVLWSMSAFDGRYFAFCGKTIESLRRNVISLLPGWLDGLFTVTERRSENKVVITCGGRSNTYYLFGGRDESSYTLIQGITLAGVLFDEAALMPRSFVEQALARCSVSGSKFWFNCNPEGQLHWFNQEWVRQSRERNMLHLHFTMDDNLSLGAEVRARYEAMYTGVFRDRYIRGLWVAAEGRVYDMFDRVRHALPALPPLEDNRYVSVDYGTQNPTVFLLWQRERSGERWICVREYYYSGRTAQRQKTDGEFADDMAAFLGDTRPRAMVVDPSAASFIAELRRRGWPVLPADNTVLDGIRDCAQLLTAGKLAFYAACVHLLEEIESYVWDEKAAQRGEDKPVKSMDHCMDAMRYFVKTILGRNTARVRSKPRGL